MRGFTLIELLISITILAFISLAIYNNTTQSFQLRQNLEQDGDLYNSVRVALDVIGRDLQQIYSPQSLALPGDLGKSSAPPTQGVGGYAPSQMGNPTAFWSEPINAQGVRPSRLQGEGEKISFIVNSHMRLFRDSQECDLAKISYGVEQDRLAPPGGSGKALVKHEDPVPFEDKDKSDAETRYTLLDDVKGVTFRYLDGEKDSFYNRWDTSGLDHKGVFPSIIEVTIEIFTPASRNTESYSRATFKVTQWFRPEMPI